MLYRFILSTIALLFCFNEIAAQCTVIAGTNKRIIECGEEVTLLGVGTGISRFKEGFNDGNADEWDNTPSGAVGTFFGSNSPVGNPYLWFGGSANSPRIAETPNLNLTPEGSLC